MSAPWSSKSRPMFRQPAHDFQKKFPLARTIGYFEIAQSIALSSIYPDQSSSCREQKRASPLRQIVNKRIHDTVSLMIAVLSVGSKTGSKFFMCCVVPDTTHIYFLLDKK
jgi:hypothetical protein